LGSIEHTNNIDEDENIRLIALFDNEEIGSQSAYGADSALLEATLRRLQANGHAVSPFFVVLNRVNNSLNLHSRWHLRRVYKRVI
jgi:aspartyl aminopeptidase